MQTKKRPFLGIYGDKRWLTLSNVLTASRIALAPCVVLVIYLQLWTVAFWMFFAAAATDFFDGYVARLCREQTFLGKALDPIADKIFLSVSFGALAFLPSPLFPIPSWFFMLVIIREVLILIGVYMVMRENRSVSIAPTLWGKATTCLQLLFILWLFVCYFAHWSPVRTYKVSLLLLSFVSVASLVQYGKKGFDYWRQVHPKNR